MLKYESCCRGWARDVWYYLRFFSFCERGIVHLCLCFWLRLLLLFFVSIRSFLTYPPIGGVRKRRTEFFLRNGRERNHEPEAVSFFSPEGTSENVETSFLLSCPPRLRFLPDRRTLATVHIPRVRKPIGSPVRFLHAMRRAAE